MSLSCFIRKDAVFGQRLPKLAAVQLGKIRSSSLSVHSETASSIASVKSSPAAFLNNIKVPAMLKQSNSD